jgi:hypothetical protein
VRGWAGSVAHRAAWGVHQANQRHHFPGWRAAEDRFIVTGLPCGLRMPDASSMMRESLQSGLEVLDQRYAAGPRAIHPPVQPRDGADRCRRRRG